ncbi:MAG TPA: amino acid adenylation domain-containing protein, partial [Streptosporangiaceae bacterium]|nr:amino acid adenylation domain-containing protein [Streptosporangiaceae bacterium]
MTQPLLSQLVGLSPEQRRAVLERVRQRGAGSNSIPRLDRRAEDGALPTSFGQDRLWFLWRLAPNSATYHVSWCYEVAGGLDVERLGTAIDALVRRHEVLRTTLHEQDGQIVQRVGPPWRCGLAAVTATGEQAFEQATAAARELFDLSAGPLLRVRAWELAPDRHVVAFTTHHVVMDGWSLDVFERELWALYDAAGDGVTAGLADPPVQYADYASWHRRLITEQASADLAYWRQALDGAAPACPAPDHPAPEHTEFSGDEAAVTVPASALGWLATSRQAAGTDFVALFAIWCLFLARHTGQRDLTVGTLVAGRSHPDTASLIGYFVNTLALRVRIDPDTDFPDYLRGVRAGVLDAFAHQEIPFEHVVREVAPRRAAARNPLFTTLFSFTSAEEADWHHRTLANGLTLTALPVSVGGSHLDLSLAATRTSDGLVLRLEYSTDLYDPATIDGYLGSLTGLINSVSHDPETPLRALLGDEMPAGTQDRSGSGEPAEPADAPYVAPQTPTERQIAQIWADLLGADAAEVGARDDFFVIGGHSLLAVRLALQLSAELSVDFPVHQIFTTPTIAGQAAFADERRGRGAAAPIPARQDTADSAPQPASFGQERLWFLWRLAPGSATYHVSWCYQADGLDVAKLAVAVDAMIARHEILRTTLRERDGQIVQRVGPPWQCGLTAVAATPAEAAAGAEAAFAELFDLSAGPLLRVRAWMTGPGTHLLQFTAHHSIIDEWSLEVFERELWALYAAGGDAAAAELPEPAIQYADYAAWHRELIAGQADDDLAYWREALDGASPACPAPDHPAPERTEFSGDQVTIRVPDTELRWLAATRTAAGTDFVALFAIWCLFLARHTGQRDLTVGTLVAGRSHPDTASLIGYFVNTLALRVRIDPAAGFPGYLRSVRAAVFDAFAHQEIPFEQVVRAVAPQRTAARNPLFTTMFSYVTETEQDIGTRDLPGGLTLTPLPSGGGGSHFDLSLTAARTPDGLVLRLEYSTDLYDRATIDGYLDSLASLLATVSADPDASLDAFSEPTPRERRLLGSWNDVSAAPTSAVPLHELMAAQAAAAPQVVAIEAQDMCLTYGELDAAVTALAWRLRLAGVREGDIVGVHLRPGATAITAILATWKAGAAFLPLDPDLPPGRITAMVGDAGPVRLITDAPSPCPELDFLLTALPGPDAAGYPAGDGGSEAGRLPAVGPGHLAYLMYTSGSTGQPKAVMIHHGGVSNHAVAQVLVRTDPAGSTVSPGSTDSRGGTGRQRVAAGTSAFIADFFISQLATLAGGHTLVVLTRDQRQDPRYLVGLAADPARAITALDCTTSQLQLLVEAGLLSAPYPPRVASFGGEACPPDLWATLRAFPAMTAVNTYGPAETSVDASIFNVAEHDQPLIGRPYGNAVIRILDDRQRPVPPGTAGELCIAGPGVGYGYLGRPAQTAAAFIPDPDGPPGTRLYRTGDLARYTTAGLLEYLGRNDHQIKILGQRVEPGEVEAALRAHPDITAAAVTAYGTPAGLQLAAHLIAAEGVSADSGAIRAWLARRLPAAAVPATIRFTTSFPLTVGGKLDRKTLAAQASADAPRAPATPPGTPAEYAIAGIWAGLLGCGADVLGVHDDFFALGGHSLLAARLALRLSTDFDIDFPLHQIFAHPTIAGQAAWISEHADVPVAPPIPRRASDAPAELPASYAQERLWFLWQLAPDSATYHISWAYEATGLDVTALAAAVDAMIERHEIFRTTLHDHDGQIVQRIGPPWRCGLTAVPATPAQAASAADTAAAELFDLSAGPLLRVRAWATGPGSHLILFTTHHVVMDEWSQEIFERELWARYAAGGDTAATAGPAAGALPDPAIQYADYAVWHRGLTAMTADDDVAWWKEDLDGAEPASPVPDHPAPDRTSFDGDQAMTTAGPGTADWLDSVRKAAATTDFVVLLAVYSIFLARHTGRRDLTIGTPISGRNHPDTVGLIGFLVNTLALRIRVDATAAFARHVAHVRQVVLDAFEHQEIPFEHVVRAVAPQRTATRNPLFTTAYAHDPATSIATQTLPGGLSLTPVPAHDGGSHFDLSLTTARTPDGIALHLAYSTDLYDRVTITGYLDSLTDLLTALAASPAAPVQTFLEPGPRERQLLASWNDAAAAPASHLPLHDLIAAQAALTPDATAIEAQDTCLNYRELDAAATALARRLRHAGISDGDIVGIHLPPSATAITAVLGIWKAGAAFLPLDTDLPPARITAMIDDARPALVVTETPSPRPDLDFVLTALPGEIVLHSEAVLSRENGDGVLPAVGPDHLAYLIYTSGSTGQPKAVMIQHRSLSNHATAQVLPWISAAAGEDRLRVAAGTSAFIADFFICQLATLGGGHTLVVLSPEQRQDPRYLIDLAADPDRAVTAIDCTTSQLQLLVEAGLLSVPCPPRFIAFGGETCPPDLWNALRAHPAIASFNSYGPAETTVEVTMTPVGESPVPLIGRPFGNVIIRILDDRLRPVPPGAVGELCIAGPGVGVGYLGRPAQTAAAFIPDPDGQPGSRLYRTGDLARFTRDGLLDFRGRNDHQIKILGQRVEPEEVEAALRAHPDIAAAAVTPRSTPGGRQLVAHLVPAEGTAGDPDLLRAWLAQRLPAAAIPAIIRYTASLPLTTGGKLDRKALAAGAAADPGFADAPVTPPSTPAEYQIAGIWASLLGIDAGSLGVHDDFFALGGHSLAAARLALRLSAEFDINIPLHQVFANPTIAGQATWISDNAGAPAVAPIPRLTRGATAEVPASYAQERLWFLWQLAPGSPTYNVSWAYQATGLNAGALAAAIDAMIERHEIFRTTLRDHDGQIVQRIGPPWHCDLTVVAATPAEADAMASEAAVGLFDLSEGPLLRVRAWATAPDTHLLQFTAHHVIIDEWSVEVFERELWRLYAAGGDATAAGLPELTIQYADYAAQHRELTAARAGDDLAWWTETLDGAEPVSPIPDHPAPDHADFSGDEASASIGPAALAWLDAARTAAATTDFVVLLAVYSIFLARHAGRRDLTIGTPVSGRGHPDTVGLIGFLVNTLSLRIRVDPAATFPEHVARVRQVVLDAFAHQEIPFDHVVRAVAPQRTAARNPLFTASYVHDVASSGAVSLPGGLTLAAYSAGGRGGSHFDLTLNTTRTADGLDLHLSYSTALYDPATITAYLASLTDLITTLAAHPYAAIQVLLEPAARETARLREWNDTATPTTAVPVPDLIAAQAAATPDATAIEAQDTTLTYRQLDAAATALARHLIARGTRPGDIIAIYLPPGATAITSILAAWKAGAAFLPLDPDLPPARIAVMIDDARPARILTTTASPSPCPSLDLDITTLDAEPADTPLPAVSPCQLAYLMYTSGSTGQPKAVMIHHGGVSNYAVAQVLPRLRSYAPQTSLRMATGTSAFISDFFMAQFVTLAGGHTLVVLSNEQRQDPRYLVSLAADPVRAVTALECTTSQLQLLIEAGLLDAPHPPRIAMFGGEHCPPDLWERLRGYPGITALNVYGPAEASVEATLHKVSASPVPLIGRPYGNTIVRILDDRQRQVPPGTAGELCIAGPGVGYGYLGRPAQTAAVFIPDPDGPPGTRLYRTGDLARYTRDGQLEFLGRIDLQIKVLGQRVEPEEVEASLRAHPDVAAAVVTAHSGPAGLRLTAHLIPAPDAEPDPGQLRAWLAERLPAPAIPAHFRVTDSFPFTTGGKLDRKALTAAAAEIDLARSPLTP